jgi:hypothetical protein
MQSCPSRHSLWASGKSDSIASMIVRSSLSSLGGETAETWSPDPCTRLASSAASRSACWIASSWVWKNSSIRLFCRTPLTTSVRNTSKYPTDCIQRPASPPRTVSTVSTLRNYRALASSIRCPLYSTCRLAAASAKAESRE